MSDQLRDKIARALHQHATDDGEVHILWGGVEEHEEEVAEWIPFADAVLAVLDLDKIRAEAWEQGSRAGWHDAGRYERSGRGECRWEGLIENPYRQARKEQSDD